MPLYTPLSGSWLNMTAHHCWPCTGRSDAGQLGRIDRMAGDHGASLGTRTPHPSSGAADAKLVASALTDGAIHLADPEPVLANQFDADSSSWNNGNVPVK